jgi:hypothetical protein
MEKRKKTLIRDFNVRVIGDELVLGTGDLTQRLPRKFLTLEQEKNLLKSCLNLDQADKKTLDFLEESGFLVYEDLDSESLFSRNHIYHALENEMDPQKITETLSQKTVGIIGCGGIGNMMAISLAGLGIQKFVLFDGDRIEESNLNRQFMYTQDDIGEFKSEVLQKALKKRYPRVQVESRHEYWNCDPISADLIVLAGDCSKLTENVKQFFKKTQQTWLVVGYISEYASWGPFWIEGIDPYAQTKTPPLNQNLDAEYLSLIEQINQRQKAPSIGPLNLLAISGAAMDVVRYLGNFKRSKPLALNKKMLISLKTLQQRDYILN